MELKFAPFCSPLDALSDKIMFCQNPNFQILAKKGVLSLHTRNSSLDGAMELKSVSGLKPKRFVHAFEMLIWQGCPKVLPLYTYPPPELGPVLLHLFTDSAMDISIRSNPSRNPERNKNNNKH